MVRPDVITFDCYGTLIDWNDGISSALLTEGERQGKAADRDAVLTAYHHAEPRVQAAGFRSYREVLTMLEAEIAGELGWKQPATPGYLADSLPGWKPFPETNRALRRLVDGGFRLGILSNIDDDLLDATLEHFEVDFDLLVTAQQLGSYKPARAHFHRALESVDGDRRRMLHVAQSYFHDVEPARTLDIDTVWVNRLAEAVPAGGPQPTTEVSDLDEAVDWIEKCSASDTGHPAPDRDSGH